jgi:hypothetical protein
MTSKGDGATRPEGGYGRAPGPIARAAFSRALDRAGPAGLDPAGLALVHVPGLVRPVISYRHEVIGQLISMGICVVEYVTTDPRGGRPHSTRPVYRHVRHAGPSGCGAAPNPEGSTDGRPCDDDGGR